jgi:hypothetical protein
MKVLSDERLEAAQPSDDVECHVRDHMCGYP